MVYLRFPKAVAPGAPAFSLKIKLGYILFVLQKGMRVCHCPVVGDALSVTLNVNSSAVRLRFFAGTGGVWDFSKIRPKA